MTRLMKFGLTAFAVLVSGCAAPPVASEKAMKIQVHTQMSTILDKCKNLGPVTARATGEVGWTESVISSGAQKARYAIREQTYDMGGDTVVLLSADFVPPNQVQAQGQALRCAQN
jgi:hypothetical protein